MVKTLTRSPTMPGNPAPGGGDATVFPAWQFALLAFASAVLALYLSFRFEFDNPGSAALTVLVVARPQAHDILPMSVWRCVGTIVGTLVALLLLALFAQSPWLFVIGFAAWMGVCVFVSVRLPDIRHFGVAVAGFTPALIAAPALNNMHQVFEIAMGRMTVVIIGVLCTALVFGLFAPLARPVEPGRSAGRVAQNNIPPGTTRDSNALQYALATAIAALVSCGFCIVTAWPASSDMLIIFGASTATLVQTDDPVRGAIGFAAGMLLAVAAGFVCLLGVWPAVDGFPLFALGLAPFVITACLFKVSPVWAGPATAYLIYLMTLISPDNLPAYDLPAYLNKAYAFIIGVLLATALFSILRPARNPHD